MMSKSQETPSGISNFLSMNNSSNNGITPGSFSFNNFRNDQQSPINGFGVGQNNQQVQFSFVSNSFGNSFNNGNASSGNTTSSIFGSNTLNQAPSNTNNNALNAFNGAGHGLNQNQMGINNGPIFGSQPALNNASYSMAQNLFGQTNNQPIGQSLQLAQPVPSISYQNPISSSALNMTLAHNFISSLLNFTPNPSIPLETNQLNLLLGSFLKEKLKEINDKNDPLS